jgi:hypothetical protein
MFIKYSLIKLFYETKLIGEKKKTNLFSKMNIFYSKSNMHISLISKNTIFSLSIGKYIKLLGIAQALWKKKNNKYKDLIFNFIFKIIKYTQFNPYFIIIKGIKNNFFFFLKYLKSINYTNLIIKDSINFTKIKNKKKTYIKRRISRKLQYVNPLKT